MDPKSEDIQKELKGVGEKLAILLMASDFPAEIKESWGALIPEMSLEQIDRLMKVLEQHISQKATEDVSAEVQKLEDQHDTNVKDSHARAIESLQQIEQQIPKQE